MTTRTKKALILTGAALLLLNLAGCTAASMNDPDMSAYSYVPQTKNVTVLTDPGIESY